MTDYQTPIPSILPKTPVDPSELPQTGFLQNLGAGFSENVGGSLRLLNDAQNATSYFQGDNALTKEQFDNSIYPDAGVQFQEGMTTANADRILQAHEDANLHAETMSRATTAGKIGYFAGSLAGGAVDPVNLLPFGAIPEGATALRAIAQGAAEQAALSVGVYSPLQAYAASQNQLPYGASDWVEQAATSALFGGIFGALGHATAGKEIPALTEKLGADSGLSPNEQTVQNIQRDLAQLPDEITPDAWTRLTAMSDEARQSANTETVGNLERDLANTAGDTKPEIAEAGDTSSKLEGDLEQTAPTIEQGTTQDPARLVYPDEQHQALYELNDQSAPEDIAKVQQAFGLGDAQETLDLAQRYRDATAMRLENMPNDRGEIPAPTIDTLTLPESQRTFTDPDLAGAIQQRFDSVRDPLTANGRIERENILQEELSSRAKNALDNDTGEIPTSQPKDGVLVQRDSRSNDGKVKEVSVSDWWRRQLRAVSTSDMGMRANATERLFNNLARLSPEQFRWLAHEHMNDATLERLYRRYVDADEAVPSRAVMAEDLLQAVHSDANRVPVATDLNSRVADRLSKAQDDAIQSSLDKEMEGYRKTDINGAMDRATGIDEINSPKDAAAYLKKTGYLDSVRDANQETVRNIQDELTKLESKRSALLDAFQCMLGG